MIAHEARFVFLDGAGEHVDLDPNVDYNVDYETVTVNQDGTPVFTHYVSPKESNDQG